MSHSMPVEVKGQLQKLFLSFHHVGPGDNSGRQATEPSQQVLFYFILRQGFIIISAILELIMESRLTSDSQQASNLSLPNAALPHLTELEPTVLVS